MNLVTQYSGTTTGVEVPKNFEQIVKAARANCISPENKEKFIEFIVRISDVNNEGRTSAEKGPVSDIISSIFQYPVLHFLSIDKECILPSYHDRDYYFDEEKGQMKVSKIFDEDFANFYALVANNCTKELDTLRTFLGEEWMQTMTEQLERAGKTIEMPNKDNKEEGIEPLKRAILGVPKSSIPEEIIPKENQKPKSNEEREV